MPSGGYQRKPYMRSCGELAGQHEYVRQLAAGGAGPTEIARAFGVSKASICKVLKGEGWNAGRGVRPNRAESGAIRCHNGRAA